VVRPGGLVYAEEFIGYARAVFEVLDFHTIDHGGLHFQSPTLVRPLDD
jgi:hypothetical protein